MHSHTLINLRLAQNNSSTMLIVHDGVIFNTRFGSRSYRLSNIKPNLTRYAGYAIKAVCLFGFVMSNVATAENVTLHAPNKAKLLFQSLNVEGDLLIAEVEAGSCGNFTLTEGSLDNKCLTIMHGGKDILNIFGDKNICRYVFRTLSPCLLDTMNNNKTPPSFSSSSFLNNHVLLGVFIGSALVVGAGIGMHTVLALA